MKHSKELKRAHSQEAESSHWLQFDQYHIFIPNLTIQERQALNLLWRKETCQFVLSQDGYLEPKSAGGIFGDNECALDDYRVKEFIDGLLKKINPSTMQVKIQESVHLIQVAPDDFLHLLFFYKLEEIPRTQYSRNLDDEVLKILAKDFSPIGAHQFHFASDEYKKSYILADLFTRLGSLQSACTTKGWSDSPIVIDGRTGKPIGILKFDDLGPFKLKNTKQIPFLRNRALMGLGLFPSIFSPSRLSSSEKILDSGAKIWGYGDLPNIQGVKAEVAASIIEKFMMQAAKKYIESRIDALSSTFDKIKLELKRQFKLPYYMVGWIFVPLTELKKQLLAHRELDSSVEEDINIIEELLGYSYIQGYRVVQETQLARFKVNSEYRTGSFQLWLHTKECLNAYQIKDGMEFLGLDKFYHRDGKTPQKKVGEFPKILFEFKALLDVYLGNLDGHPENILFITALNNAIGFRSIDHSIAMGRKHPSASKELEKMYGWVELEISDTTPSPLIKHIVQSLYKNLSYLLSDLIKLYDERPFDSTVINEIRAEETKAILLCFVERFSLLQLHIKQGKPYRLLGKARTAEELANYRKVLDWQANYEFSQSHGTKTRQTQTSQEATPKPLSEEPSSLLQFSMSLEAKAPQEPIVAPSLSPKQDAEPSTGLQRSLSQEQLPVIMMRNMTINDESDAVAKPSRNQNTFF